MGTYGGSFTMGYGPQEISQWAKRGGINPGFRRFDVSLFPFCKHLGDVLFCCSLVHVIFFYF